MDILNLLMFNKIKKLTTTYQSNRSRFMNCNWGFLMHEIKMSIWS